jgi:hypothetical protein
MQLPAFLVFNNVFLCLCRASRRRIALRIARLPRYAFVPPLVHPALGHVVRSASPRTLANALCRLAPMKPIRSCRSLLLSRILVSVCLNQIVGH